MWTFWGDGIDQGNSHQFETTSSVPHPLFPFYFAFSRVYWVQILLLLFFFTCSIGEKNIYIYCWLISKPRVDVRCSDCMNLYHYDRTIWKFPRRISPVFPNASAIFVSARTRAVLSEYCWRVTLYETSFSSYKSTMYLTSPHIYVSLVDQVAMLIISARERETWLLIGSWLPRVSPSFRFCQQK